MSRLGVIVVAILASCGGGSSPDLENRDPRCVSSCTDEPPSVEGAGEVCSTASRDGCLDECEARIAGVSTICASCLLEDSCFDPNGCGPTVGDFCDNDTCTTTGPEGSCTYPIDDDAAREDCRRQVDPRVEVACSPEFRSVGECSTECD